VGVIVHLDGVLVPAEKARVSPFDRGFLFGDGVYEGLRTFDGAIVGLDRHLLRMARSLAEMRLAGFDIASVAPLTDALLEANRLKDAFVYWQVSRGAPLGGEPLRTRLPAWRGRPTVFAYAAPLPSLAECREPAAITAATVVDTRWTRLHVKSISLMANIVGAVESQETGASEAIFIRDGLVSEATASNVVLVVDGQVVTPMLGVPPMLEGVTRSLLLGGAPDVVQRPVHLEELHRASEVMSVGTTAMVTSITRVNGAPVGDGSVGPQARRLYRALVEAVRRDVAPRLRREALSSST
jgi:D-alanine transaminase